MESYARRQMGTEIGSQNKVGSDNEQDGCSDDSMSTNPTTNTVQWFYGTKTREQLALRANGPAVCLAQAARPGDVASMIPKRANGPAVCKCIATDSLRCGRHSWVKTPHLNSPPSLPRSLNVSCHRPWFRTCTNNSCRSAHHESQRPTG